MATNIAKAVEQIKGNLSAVLPGDVIVKLCAELGHKWRARCMDPVTTVHAFVIQVLHCNTACDHLPHILGKSFTGEAYCMARSRLPLELFQRLCKPRAGCCRRVVVPRPGTATGSGYWMGPGAQCLTQTNSSVRRIQRGQGAPAQAGGL